MHPRDHIDANAHELSSLATILKVNPVRKNASDRLCDQTIEDGWVVVKRVKTVEGGCHAV